ncbi:MAG: glycosyltransferase family 2 protein [Desulfotignum sp.]|nr:glycosyltransferase family 2 protein [Desulfotignum sp.]MCF8124703.1 glycosyltransferase family 2 protein [Desulfotignum sp.]
MKISVIVTTYNRPLALEKVLTALYAQTRLPDEILVADDGSGDETRKVLAAFKKRQYPKFYHVWQEDKGFRLARIRNKAILASRADYLVFLDGDCIPEKHFVEDHQALARKGFFFQGKRVLVKQKVENQFDFKDIDSIIRRLYHVFCLNISNSHHVLRIPFFPSCSTGRLSGVRGCNMGFFKQDLMAVNGYNESFNGWGREDQEIVVRLYKYGLMRKENPFKAICYHLWHRENSRISLDHNDKLLEQAMASDLYVCQNGLKNKTKRPS